MISKKEEKEEEEEDEADEKRSSMEDWNVHERKTTDRKKKTLMDRVGRSKRVGGL